MNVFGAAAGLMTVTLHLILVEVVLGCDESESESGEKSPPPPGSLQVLKIPTGPFGDFTVTVATEEDLEEIRP